MKKKQKIISFEAFVQKLGEFLKDYPEAVQLDGSIGAVSNPRAWAVFEVEGMRFRLNADTKTSAIVRFFSLGASRDALILSKTEEGKPCFRLKDSITKSEGWYCYLYNGNSAEVARGKSAA